MSDTPKIVIEDALTSDPSWWMLTIPTPPFDVPRIKANWFALVDEVKRLQPIERELADLKAQHAWRPIETAPKDGTKIIAWREDAGVLVISFTESHSETDDENEYTGEPCWFTERGEDLTGYVPTHWQPLPDPPKEGAE